MRIACISTSSVPSRTANSVQVMKVCQAMADLGHDVRLWLPRRPSPAWPALAEQYGVRGGFRISRLREMPGLRRYDFCLSAVLSAKRWPADLVYVWPFQAAALASRLGLPTVLELHDLPRGTFGPRLLGVFLRGHGARRLAYTTGPLRAWVEARHRLPQRPGFAVRAPNGVDLSRYAGLPKPSAARRALGIPEAFTAGYTGHLYSGRGIDLLHDLARRNPDILFLWVGGEPQAVDKWRARLSAEGIENVWTTGFVPNDLLPMLQASCDVLLMPYERRIAVSGGGDTSATASPMKAFEYLATGRAILSSDLPVLREVLNSENAILLPSDDLEAWDRCLKELASDARLLSRLGARARADAKMYGWDHRQQMILDGLETGRGD